MADVTKLNIGGTDYNIVDASVPSWAKQSTKPTYTANEINGLATVATSGSYNDLSNKPTIKTINNLSLLGSGNITPAQLGVSITSTVITNLTDIL